MAAPKGNRFWEMRSKHGRNPTFASHEELWDACCEYFEWVEDNPLLASEVVKYQGDATLTEVPKMRAMTMDGLCLFLGITDQTWHNYKDRGDDFLEVITQAEKIVRIQKFTGAAADMLNPNIIARDLGLVDRQDLKHSGDINDISDEQLEKRLAALMTKAQAEKQP